MNPERLRKELGVLFGLPDGVEVEYLIHVLDEIRVILGNEGLYVERAGALMRSSSMEDKLACKYINAATRLWLQSPELSGALKQRIFELADMLRGVGDG